MGQIARANIAGLGADQLAQRVRTRVAESSCGLCSIENLDALAKPLPQVPAHEPPKAQEIFAAIEHLQTKQQLHTRPGSPHGSASPRPDGTILLLTDDVGRHTPKTTPDG